MGNEMKLVGKGGTPGAVSGRFFRWLFETTSVPISFLPGTWYE